MAKKNNMKKKTERIEIREFGLWGKERREVEGNDFPHFLQRYET